MISPTDIARLKNRAAVERLIEKHYHGNAARFVDDINTTVNHLLHSNLKKAGRFLDHVRVVFRFVPRTYAPRLMALEARYAHWTGNSRKAKRLYERATECMLSARQFDGAARARLGLMDVCMYLGSYREALRQGQRALAFFRRKNDSVRIGRTLTNIGNIYHRTDRNTLALRYYDRARPYFEKEGGVPLAIVDYNRANICANLNEIATAEKLYSSVAETYRCHNMTLVAGRAEYSLAYLYFLSDKYTQALAGFEKVMETFEAVGDKKAVAITRLDLAEINGYLNQYGSAVALGQDVMAEFGRHGLRYEQAKAGYFIAESLRHLGDYPEAERYLRKSERLFAGEENLLWQGLVMLERARLHIAREQYRPAITIAENALRLFSRSDDRRRRTDAEITLMEARFKAGDGIRTVRTGEKLLVRPLVSYQQHAVLDLLGRYYLAHNVPRRALEYFRKAIAVVEKMLVHLYPDEIRFFFALDKCETYFGAAECLLQLDRVEDSFLQRSRALAILNRRHRSNALLQREVPERLLEMRANLRASLKKLQRIPDPDRRGIEGTSSMRRLEQQLWANEMEIRSHLYPARSRHRVTVSDVRLYRDFLKSDEALVHFVFNGDTVGAYCATTDTTTYTESRYTRGKLEQQLRELHFLMENAVYSPNAPKTAATINSYLSELSRGLMELPIFSSKASKIIFLVDGAFAQIPYGALPIPGNGRSLKDEFDLRLIVNPDDLAVRSENPGQVSAKQSAVFASSSATLPMVEQEGQDIARFFPNVRLYIGAEASSDNLKRELGYAEGFVHIAAHAARSSENPLFSRILMSDGPFFPFDLFGAGIDARLVTLSGCQTAAPGVYYGNSFSLAKIFYQGGAGHVLASLWPVSDKVSMIFMVEFYRVLREHSDIAAAYRAAMGRAASLNNNPAFWSPFVLVGL